VAFDATLFLVLEPPQVKQTQFLPLMRRLKGFVLNASGFSLSPTFYTLRKRRYHKPNCRNYND
jgi:hypothetical protein